LEAFCGVSCIARPVGYPHLYNYVVSHEYQTFIFLVSFGVVACAWRRERTLSESARQPNVREIGSSNKSFDMEPGAIGRSKSRYDRYGPIQWAKFGKVFGEAGFDGGSQTARCSGVEKTGMTGTTGRLARGGEKRRREAARR
jgi:hypothetical protein